MTKTALNYLKDVFHCDTVKKLTPPQVHSMLENVEMTPGEFPSDKELAEAYFKLNGLKPMTAEQFYARKC